MTMNDENAICLPLALRCANPSVLNYSTESMFEIFLKGPPTVETDLNRCIITCDIGLKWLPWQDISEQLFRSRDMTV